VWLALGVDVGDVTLRKEELGQVGVLVPR